MDGQAIVSVSALVVAFVQLAKWGFVPDRYGPLAVLVFSVLGVATWGVDQWQRFHLVPQIFDYVAGLAAVMTSAAGVFGFTRSTGDAISKMRATNSDDVSKE